MSANAANQLRTLIERRNKFSDKTELEVFFNGFGRKIVLLKEIFISENALFAKGGEMKISLDIIKQVRIVGADAEL